MQTIDAQPVAFQGANVRSEFIKKTYINLMSAIACFTLIEIIFFKTNIAFLIVNALSGNWMIAMIAFVIAGMAASRAAFMSHSKTTQYIALYAYVLIEALIFTPILAYADFYAPGVIQSAAIVTLLAFGALTAFVIMSKTDFSFLGSLLKWVSIMALVFIVAGALFGFQLGTLFSVGMVGLAGGYILYDTSNIIHHYPSDRYVGAALSLFASVAMMFFYVLRIFLANRD